jgi:hypothetical protein
MNAQRLDLLRQDTSNGQLAVIKLEGKLSLETVSNFLQSMRPEPAPELILEMSGVKFLDSAGVGALAQLFVHRRRDPSAGRSWETQGTFLWRVRCAPKWKSYGIA